MKENANVGFKYTITHRRGDEVLSVEEVDNIIPTEGCNYLLNVGVKAGVSTSSWFIGLFSGNYTPVAGDTAATFPAAATESTAYAEAARVAWTPGAVANGSVSSSAQSIFTMNAPTTIYGGFMSSLSTKGGTTGTLISAVKFAAPKTVLAGDVLQVTSALTLIGA